MGIVYADPVFCTLIGADSPEQLVGQSLTDIVAPEYHDTLREQVTRIERQDASVLDLAVDIQTLTNERESVILVSSLLEWDGTHQVQTLVLPVIETDSPTAQLLRDQAMDEAPIGITISDPSQPDNPLTYVNDGFCALTGYPRDDILGQNCRFLQGEATREEPITQMRAAINAQEPVTVDLRNYRKDGSMFWNRVTIVPIRSESGNVTNYLGYQQDVTDEKRFEEDLTLFEEQAKASEKAIFITDPDGTIQYVNPAFEQVTGYAATEAVGKNPRLLKSGQQDDEFYAELWERITAGKVWEADLTNRTKSGGLYEVRQKIIPITDRVGDIRQFVAIEEDTTEETLRTQALDVLNRVLRHNLRNALNAIDGNAELLESGELDAEARQASVRVIREQAQSLQEIAEKIGEVRGVWEQTEANRGWGSLDIGALIEAYRRQYPDAKISASIAGDEKIRVRNVSLFKVALGEAVENAIKHVDQSPLELTVTVVRDMNKNHVRISVADNGPGIPEHEWEVIESGRETPLHHGLGIGFWLMEWVATTLGGELLISEDESQGGVVTFQLPIGR
jgi:PAS domain S-box-containing protein